jgi:ATP-dependent DNA helicase RecQ
VIAYYQQVGRAGRAVDRAYGILLSGMEDDEIQDYFIETAFPNQQAMLEILDALEKHESLSFEEILSRVNVAHGVVEKVLKLLEVDGAVGTIFNGKVLYFRTPNLWQPDTQRIERVLSLRRAEQSQMQSYMEYKGCLMEFLLKALDDPNPRPCCRCANCRGIGLPTTVSHELVIQAEDFLKAIVITIDPHKRWPAGVFLDQKRIIPVETQNCPGRSLCYYGDAGFGKLVRDGKYVDGHFRDALVDASFKLITRNWSPSPFPTWITAIPSHRHPTLVSDFAIRLASRLNIPFLPALIRTGVPPEQKTMQNSTMQARNVIDTLMLKRNLPPGPVLLVDDIIDSGWTLTMAGYLLSNHGSGDVYPFTLAKATARNL